MKNLEGRIKKLESLHGAEGAQKEVMYTLKWEATVPVTKVVYRDHEFYRTDGEPFDTFQSRVSDKIRRLPAYGGVRTADVWIDNETRAEMQTEETIVACIFDRPEPYVKA